MALTDQHLLAMIAKRNPHIQGNTFLNTNCWGVKDYALACRFPGSLWLVNPRNRMLDEKALWSDFKRLIWSWYQRYNSQCYLQSPSQLEKTKRDLKTKGCHLRSSLQRPLSHPLIHHHLGTNSQLYIWHEMYHTRPRVLNQSGSVLQKKPILPPKINILVD